MSKRTTIGLLAIMAICAVLSLVTGASFLEWRLPGGLPLGNAIAATGLCALAGITVAIAQPGTGARFVSWGALLAAAAWLPVSIALAGNLSLNFTWARGTIWMWVTLATLAAIVLALAWALIARVVASRRPSAKA